MQAAHIQEQDHAHAHFSDSRQIKLKEAQGMPLPTTSYIEHYPPKELLQPGEPLELNGGTVPFTAESTYNTEFFPKPRMARPVEPLTYTHRPLPSIIKVRQGLQLRAAAAGV